MDVKVLLNAIESYKGFVYEEVRWKDHRKSLEVEIRPRKGSSPICSGCGVPGSTYDHLTERLFQYVPLWGLAVWFVYAKRRVDCKTCGVKVESVPWCTGKKHHTRSFSLFLAQWARRLSWQETATIFGTSWDRVRDAVSWVVSWGLEHRTLGDVRAVGVDEIQFGKGHKYLTLVYQIDAGARRLLSIGQERTVKTLQGCFAELGPACCKKIQYVCSDMWKPYLKVIAKRLPGAVHVLDRFHVVGKLSKAVDTVRREEVRDLKSRGKGKEKVLAKTKYCLLKNPENLTEGQEVRLNDILHLNLRSVRAYQLKDSFRLFWKYTSPYWANWYLKKWCTRAMRSRLEPIKKFVGTIRRHEDLIMNWFRAKKAYSSGVVEGLNRKVNLITRKAYGYRSLEVLKIALFHELGGLPEPESTHRFC